MGEDLLKQHAVMGLDAPFQSFLQLRQFPPASVPRANSVSVCASLCPLLPHTSDTTLVSLIVAVSKTDVVTD